MKLKLLVSALFLMPAAAMAALPNTGFYQTIDDKTNQPKSIVALYENNNELFGRIVALYDVNTGKISETVSNPTRIAEKVKGTPKMVGLDIIWNMKWDSKDSEYSDGEIMDPKKGNVYSSVIWLDKQDTKKLHVRGKIGPFGRTQVWNVLNVKDLPADLQKLDIKNWKPVVVK